MKFLKMKNVYFLYGWKVKKGCSGGNFLYMFLLMFLLYRIVIVYLCSFFFSGL